MTQLIIAVVGDFTLLLSIAVIVLSALDNGVGFLQQCQRVRKVAVVERVNRVLARFDRALVVIRMVLCTVEVGVIGHGYGYNQGTFVVQPNGLSERISRSLLR